MSDKNDGKIITHNPLPTAVTSILRDTTFITEQLNNGKNPVDLSIDKWDKILQVYNIISAMDIPYLYYQQIYEKIGYQTCALCLYSTRRFLETHKYMKYKEDKCTLCPFADIDCCINKDSIYQKINTILNRKYDFGSDLDEKILADDHIKLKMYIESFINNLKKLK